MRRPVAALRNHIESTIAELTDSDRMRLARQDAKTLCGMLTRTAGAILAHALHRLGLA